MVHDPLFDSAWLKWAQAIVHSQTLEREIDAARLDRDANPVRAARAEYHPKRHGFGIVVDELAPVPFRWRLLVGDIANNYRSALDHLAWAIVSRGRTPPSSGKLKPRAEKFIYFPIYEQRAKFNDSLPTKLPGARRADIAKVRRAQPYHHGPRTRPRNSLVLLNDINMADKHRAIQPLWSFPSRVDLEVTHIRDCILSDTAHWRREGHPLEIGTEVAFIRARKRGANPELEVNVQITSEPTIGNRISVRQWSHGTGIGVFNMLRQFSGQPPGIHEIGAELVRLPGT